MATIFQLEEEVIYIKRQYKFEKDRMKNENTRALTSVGRNDEWTDGCLAFL